ncbi:MAG: M23 family metallopeptidase [Ignavibacteria bacterium]|nr:M23 family metallopeptidase [Ignavibacteria bacterium]
MEKEKITLLIVSDDNSPVKSFNISKSLFTNYKKYITLASVFLAFFIFSFVVVFLYGLNAYNDRNRLNSEVLLLNSQIRHYDSLSLSKKLNSIDINLSMINSYLNERGLLEISHSGGEQSAHKQVNLIDKIDYFEKKSVVFYSTIRELPLGLPHYGKVTSDYGYRRNPFGGYGGEFHPGVDFKGEIGEPVTATGDGIVIKSEWYGGYGNCVIIKHNSGYESLYGHMSKLNAVTGQEVKAGDLIGYIGSTGRSTGPHLHYEIRKNGMDIDPTPFLTLHK